MVEAFATRLPVGRSGRTCSGRSLSFFDRATGGTHESRSRPLAATCVALTARVPCAASARSAAELHRTIQHELGFARAHAERTGCHWLLYRTVLWLHFRNGEGSKPLFRLAGERGI